MISLAALQTSGKLPCTRMNAASVQLICSLVACISRAISSFMAIQGCLSKLIELWENLTHDFVCSTQGSRLETPQIRSTAWSSIKHVNGASAKVIEITTCLSNATPLARVVIYRNMLDIWIRFYFGSFLRCHISSRHCRRTGPRGGDLGSFVRCCGDRHASEQAVQMMHTQKARGVDTSMLRYPPLSLGLILDLASHHRLQHPGAAEK